MPNLPIQDLIDGVSQLITQELRRLRSEQAAPARSPDQSDDFIKATTGNVGKLRQIRSDLEEIATQF